MLKTANLKLLHSGRHGLIFYVALYFPTRPCTLQNEDALWLEKEGAKGSQRPEISLCLSVSEPRPCSAFTDGHEAGMEVAGFRISLSLEVAEKIMCLHEMRM